MHTFFMKYMHVHVPINIFHAWLPTPYISVKIELELNSCNSLKTTFLGSLTYTKGNPSIEISESESHTKVQLQHTIDATKKGIVYFFKSILYYFSLLKTSFVCPIVLVYSQDLSICPLAPPFFYQCSFVLYKNWSWHWKTDGLITKENSMKRNPQQTDNWIRIHSYIVVA